MACEIRTESVIGRTGAGGALTAVEVQITAFDCRAVLVTMSCAGGPEHTVEVAVAPDGSWPPAVFAGDAILSCGCNQPLEVRAVCRDNPDCEAAPLSVSQLECRPPLPSECPESVSIAVTLDADACAGVGSTVTARFMATLDRGVGGTYEWDFDVPGEAPVPGGAVIDKVYAEPGTYTVTVLFLPDAGSSCRARVGRAEVHIPACECPRVSLFLTELSGCVGPIERERATAAFRVTSTIIPPDAQWAWDFDDGFTEIHPAEERDVTHIYETTGTFNVTVSLHSPSIEGTECIASAQASTSLEVVGCCAFIRELRTVLEGCADIGTGRVATVGFFPIINAPPEPLRAELQWTFGDGESATTPGAAPITHIYREPGPKTVEVTLVNERPGCPPARFAIDLDIPACTTTPTSPGSGESNGCLWLRRILTFLLALAILQALLAICFPPAATALWISAAAAAVGFVVLLIIWLAIGCAIPCGAVQLITSLAFLSAAYAAAYFTFCCPWIAIVAAGLLGAGLLLAYWWLTQCKQSLCYYLNELFWALLFIVVPIITNLAAIRIPGEDGELESIISCTGAALPGILAGFLAIATVIVADRCGGLRWSSD